jgi:hypothetical protein
VTLDPEMHMVLKDRTGREFGTDVDSFEFMPTNLDIFLEPVNPGISKNGRVIYQRCLPTPGVSRSSSTRVRGRSILPPCCAKEPLSVGTRGG